MSVEGNRMLKEAVDRVNNIFATGNKIKWLFIFWVVILVVVFWLYSLSDLDPLYTNLINRSPKNAIVFAKELMAEGGNLDNSSGNSKVVPFYVYKGSEFEWYINCTKNITEDGLAKLLKKYKKPKYGTDLVFYERIQKHPWRVFDPDQAKIFVIPALMTFAKYYGEYCVTNPNTTTLDNDEIRNEMLKQTVKSLKESPYFKRKAGRDHLIVSSHYSTRTALNDFAENDKSLANIILANYEDYAQGMGYVANDRLSKWGCTVVIPHNNKPTIPYFKVSPDTHRDYEKDIENQKELVSDLDVLNEFKERPFDTYFMGQINDNIGYDIREELGKLFLSHKQLSTVPSVYISSSNVQDNTFQAPACNFTYCIEAKRCICTFPRNKRYDYYSYLMLHTKFALITSGDTPTTNRLYDALCNGVIPIIISNGIWKNTIYDNIYSHNHEPWPYGLPFPHTVPWFDLAYFIPWPEKELRGEDRKASINRVIKMLNNIFDDSRGGSSDEVLKRLKLIKKHRSDICFYRDTTKQLANISSDFELQDYKIVSNILSDSVEKCL